MLRLLPFVLCMVAELMRLLLDEDSCRRPCFGRTFGLDDPQRSLPNPNIL